MFLSSCSITSSLQDNETLLIKNKIVFKGKTKIKNKLKVSEDLQILTFQKPNSKLFYIFPLKLSIYNMAYRRDKPERKFGWWVKNKLGEPPVVFNEPLIYGSANSMETYMFNLGFLHNKVSTSVKIKKRKAVVNYIIEPNKQFKINNIVLPSDNDEITKIILKNQKHSLLKKKDFFNVNTLDNERNRLTNVLRDEGYYFFNKEYLRYDIDSLGKGNKLDLILKVLPPTNENGQKKFTINEVTIFTDYKIERINKEFKLDSFDYDGYHFITEKNLFKPKPLLFGVYLKKGDIYKISNHHKTFKKLVSFGTFKFVNIEYKLVENNKLDVFIYLSPAKKQVLAGDVELSIGYEGLLLGTKLSLTYKNKNLTKKSDLLQFKISSGVELNLFDKTRSVLNTADVNTELSYTVNRFILPFPLKKVSKNSNVKTRFSLAYNFENRIEKFVKHSTTFSAGYEWNETQRKKHFYNPINISLLLIPEKDPSFIKQLEEIPSLKHSFEENIIFGSNYTFLMTNKKGEKDNSYFNFQGNIDLAGNFIHLLMLAVNSKKSDTLPYQILGKDYAQFARFEGNFVHHDRISTHSKLVTRLNAGIIIPYGNSKVAPYFQQFYAGGANSIRAFRLRSLGPGSFAKKDFLDNNNFYFDQSGDIKIEANIEYRFDVWKWFKWAFFVDAGNVWLLKKDTDRPHAHFTNKFYNDIAIGFGTGLRMDFTYFVIRTDLAMPIIDPRFPEGEKWRLNQKSLGINNWSKTNLIFNLAIGYPF